MPNLLEIHYQELKKCSLCPQMIGPVISGLPVKSKVLLVGQAPGVKEGPLGKPFAWTAGKTLFKWIDKMGLSEEEFREKAYMAAVCRCFPGKNPKGGDRVPSTEEVANCSSWLNQEIRILKPKLIIPVGKLAISQFLVFSKLTEVVGQSFSYQDLIKDTGRQGPRIVDSPKTSQYEVIPLPHPSGASTWHRTEPGVGLLETALKKISKHAAWKGL